MFCLKYKTLSFAYNQSKTDISTKFQCFIEENFAYVSAIKEIIKGEDAKHALRFICVNECEKWEYYLRSFSRTSVLNKYIPIDAM